MVCTVEFVPIFFLWLFTMQIEKLLKDNGITYATNHKNIRDGWIGIEDCPFCNSVGKFHLGYSLEEHYFSCWKCGGHNTPYTIQKLLRVSRDKAEAIIKQYGGTSKVKKIPKVRTGTNRFKLPPTVPHNSRSWTYLKRRGFDDPDELINLWGLLYTGPMSQLDNLNFSNRVLAPIIWDGQIVSFQARDISDKHIAKYMACPPEREIISHKHILYGLQGYWQRRKGICVEGIVDVWRFGPGAFATLGIKFTRHQIKEIKNHFDEVVIIYDPEKWAQWQARTLMNELKFKGVKAQIVDLHCDPGDLTQEEADIIVEDLMK